MSIPEQPFGFVAGRWVLSLADTPMDSDRAPDYKPLYPGSVIFNNKLSHRVVTDGSETVGIVKTRYEAQLNEDGRVIDAEEHEFIALPVGVYSVSYSFGQYAWPNHDIEVKAEHTLESPLWLPNSSPLPSGPSVVQVVNEASRIAAEAAATSAETSAMSAGNSAGLAQSAAVTATTSAVAAEAAYDSISDALKDVRTLKNLLPNGNFAQGSTGWGANQANVYISEGEARLTPWGTSPSAALLPGASLVRPNETHVYYIRFTRWGTTSSRGGIYVGRVLRTAYYGEPNEYNTYSFRFTNFTQYLMFYAKDGVASNVAGEEVAFKDITVLDLTETYGAGNEPSIEYMDALLESRGGYVDGEDPQVGDAYSDLTVFGPGMTLRHDNSVGERVFLDHPGGSTMLHGDTGWRNITPNPLPTQITEGTILLRRVNNETLVDFRNLKFAKNTDDTSLALPFWWNVPIGGTGFGTHTPYANFVELGSNPSAESVVGITASIVATTLYMRVMRHQKGTAWLTTLNANTNDSFSGTLRHPTGTAWPTTLPGTPL